MLAASMSLKYEPSIGVEHCVCRIWLTECCQKTGEELCASDVRAPCSFACGPHWFRFVCRGQPGEFERPTQRSEGGGAQRDVAAGGGSEDSAHVGAIGLALEQGGEGKRRRKEGVEEVADTVRGLDKRVSSILIRRFTMP